MRKLGFVCCKGVKLGQARILAKRQTGASTCGQDFWQNKVKLGHQAVDRIFGKKGAKSNRVYKHKKEKIELVILIWYWLVEKRVNWEKKILSDFECWVKLIGSPLEKNRGNLPISCGLDTHWTTLRGIIEKVRRKNKMVEKSAYML